MNLENELRQEHDTIKQAVAVLDRMADKMLTSTDAVIMDDVEALLMFFSDFLDTGHFGKEEHHLFPVLEKAAVEETDDLTDLLVSDHDRIRQCLTRLFDLLPLIKASDTAAMTQIDILIKHFRTIVAAHVEKEEAMAYPLIAEHLPPGKQEELINNFKRYENQNRAEPEKEKQDPEMLERLRRRYGWPAAG